MVNEVPEVRKVLGPATVVRPSAGRRLLPFEEGLRTARRKTSAISRATPPLSQSNCTQLTSTGSEIIGSWILLASAGPPGETTPKLRM